MRHLSLGGIQKFAFLWRENAGLVQTTGQSSMESLLVFTIAFSARDPKTKWQYRCSAMWFFFFFSNKLHMSLQQILIRQFYLLVPQTTRACSVFSPTDKAISAFGEDISATSCPAFLVFWHGMWQFWSHFTQRLFNEEMLDVLLIGQASGDFTLCVFSSYIEWSRLFLPVLSWSCAVGLITATVSFLDNYSLNENKWVFR